MAYYIVSKTVDGMPLFDSAESFGNRVYGAAAQVFAQYLPDDPRGAALRGRHILPDAATRGDAAAADTVVEVPATGHINIVRYDYAGREHSLDSVASQGKIVLLNFTAYELPQSPAYNAMLNELYSRYHERGLEIYQLAFDSDEVAWKNAAANLPWITSVEFACRRRNGARLIQCRSVANDIYHRPQRRHRQAGGQSRGAGELCGTVFLTINLPYHEKSSDQL